MTPEEIAASLKLKGSSQAEIARETGYSISAVNSVIYRRRLNKSNNQKIRLAIAEKLGFPVSFIFKDHCNNTIINREDMCVNGKP